jgi:glycyl-tRNA synthetase beta chain
VDHEKRKASIIEQIRKIEAERSVRAEIDEDLLNEVVFLVEYPTAFVGEFEDEFMSLPKEAVITPMKDHQRYFPVFKGDDLLPYFVCIRNGNDSYIDQVKKGNEKVLRARLKDAQFFYNEDLKSKLGDRVEVLNRIVYKEKLGTIYDKDERFASIADFIAQKLGLDEKKRGDLKRAAFLSKADLVTGLVNEFEELQGVMGKEYALKNGESEEIAQAIFSHYLPRFSGDVTPSDTFGMILSIADKMDTIVGSFSIGVQPTGSQDPGA